MDWFERDLVADEMIRAEEVVAVEQYDRDMEQRAFEQEVYDQEVRREEIIDYGVGDRFAQEVAYDNYESRQAEMIQQEIRQEQLVRQDEMMDAYGVGFGERRLIEKEEVMREERALEYEREKIEYQEAQTRLNNYETAIQQVEVEGGLQGAFIQPLLPAAELATQAINTADRLQSPIYYHHFFEWKEGIGILANAEVIIGDKTTRLSDIGKIKVMKELAIDNSRKIKLSHLTGDTIFSVQPKKAMSGVPLHYVWMARIITQKLYLKGYDLLNPYVPERRFTNSHCKEPLIDGILYKQSQYFKTWELRYVVITPEGLSSFKDETGGESFTIKRDTATELWTRFDIHEKMLVIKIHHNGRKTEFGIPIVDYCRVTNINWLLAFQRLVFPF